MKELNQHLKNALSEMQAGLAQQQNKQAVEIKALQDEVHNLSNQLQRMSEASTHLQNCLDDWNSKFGSLLKNS